MPAVKQYSRINFENVPSHNTPLNATNLNKLDKGIDDLDNSLVTAKNNIETLQTNTADIENNLSGYIFFPAGEVDLVALVADNSFYTDAENKYVIATSATGRAMIDGLTYKALASDTDLYGIEGEDTASGFEPSCTPITVGEETLSTIDDKLNYLVENKIAIDDLLKLYEGNSDYTYVSDFNGKMLVILGATSRYGTSFSLTVGGNSVSPLISSTYANGSPSYTHSNYAIYVVDVEVGQSVISSVSVGSTSDQAYYGKFEGFYKMQ